MVISLYQLVRLVISQKEKLIQFVLPLLLNSHQREHIMNILIMEAVMTGLSAVRDAQGRFVAGQSGNPSGKAPGTRNRASVLREALDGEEGPAMARIIIDKALAGDVVTAKFCIARLMPKPRDRAIEIDLLPAWPCHACRGSGDQRSPREPEGARAADIVAAYDATVRAMASGEITPDEALQVSRVLDGRRKAIEAAAREAEREARGARRAAAKPSPSGRGLGEGVGGAFDGARTEAVRRPHPDPLPWGEGMAGTSCIARNADLTTTLLHSTCISRSPPPAWLAASLPCDGFRPGLQRV
jgi:uncharacterized protein DUF5681